MGCCSSSKPLQKDPSKIQAAPEPQPRMISAANREGQQISNNGFKPHNEIGGGKPRFTEAVVLVQAGHKIRPGWTPVETMPDIPQDVANKRSEINKHGLIDEVRNITAIPTVPLEGPYSKDNENIFAKGQYNVNNQPEGYCMLYTSQSVQPFGQSGTTKNKKYTIYEGGVLDGKRNGRGIQIWTNYSYYIGDWKNDEIHGSGLYLYSDGTEIEGGWIKGAPSTKTIITLKDGSRFDLKQDFSGRFDGTRTKMGQEMPVSGYVKRSGIDLTVERPDGHHEYIKRENPDA